MSKNTPYELTISSVVSIANNHLSCSLGEGIAILNINNRNRFSLDPVGKNIWQTMKKPITVNSIIESLMDEYNVPFEKCKKDTLHLLNELLKSGLIIVEKN